MTHTDIRKKFLDFFEKKGHKIVPSSSLLPDDPSVLFTTAGMQQFKPYYTGEADPIKDFGALNTVSIQKSIRTSDIDEVGDETHLTFFEMLGNFSFGGYFKKEAIEYAHEFITKEIGVSISYVTVFQGSTLKKNSIPKDEESKEIWQSLGVTDIREEGMEDVFWGPTGNSGPCGPTTEIYCKSVKGQDVEVWNIVFNEFFCDGSRGQLFKGKAKLTSLEKKGIDTGMGLERLAMISQNVENIFETDLFKPLIDAMSELTDIRVRRIIVDHCRASAFLITDGVRPSNKDQGYILRRLLRRIITHGYILSENKIDFDNLFRIVVDNYGFCYKDLDLTQVVGEFHWEKGRFDKAFINGRKELKRFFPISGLDPDNLPPGTDISGNIVRVPGAEVYKIYESYGLNPELSQEIMKSWGMEFDQETLREAEEIHKEKSRAGAEKKFGGHGLILDTGELKAANEEELKIVTRLHTATHMLHAALRKVLGDDVHQAGSDITAERLRFDFTFPRKLIPGEIEQVENLVNEAIKKDLTVTKQEMPYEEAVKTGALSFFKLKYPPKVNVYSVGDFSKELCGGPHVAHTGEIGHFKIVKEEASSAGVRRIRAVVK